MLDCKKEFFSLPADLCYLNGAYMSPNLKSVEAVGIESVRKKNNPLNIITTDFFAPVDELREVFARLIHSKDPENCVLIPSVSYAVANAAKNIPLCSGDEILLVGEQFPSNYYSWKKLAAENNAALRIVEADRTQDHPVKYWNEKILESIHSRTKIIAMPIVHWADGSLFDIAKIRSVSSAYDSYLLVDGTQSVGAMDLNLKEIKLDFLVVAAYKWLLGPYSAGMAYYGERFLDGEAIEESWMNRYDSDNFAQLVNYQDSYRLGARRYEVGQSSNFIAVPMMQTAIRQLNEWKPSEIQAYCKHITSTALQTLSSEGFVIEDAAYRAHHLFGIRVRPKDDLVSITTKLKAAKISVSIRGDAIRVSPNVYNEQKDIEQLVEVLVSGD